MFLPGSVLRLAAGRAPETSGLTGINMEKGLHRKSNVPGACQRGLILHPWKNTAKGPTLHRPGRAAFHSLTKTISAGLLFYAHCLAPLSGRWNGFPVLPAQKAPLFRFCRLLSRLFSTLGRFPPLWVVGGPPSVDDGSSATARVKMVVSCLHNGSG